jgi:4'-phosphopantetheinyl transferase
MGIATSVTVTDWAAAPGGCSPGDVHVWRINLDRASATFDRLEKVLSPLERERISRFTSADLRRRSATARAALRIILARYVGVAPERLSFDFGPQGKPSLSGCDATIQFNLTHTGSLAFLAVAAEAMGIDAELINPKLEWEELSSRFFAPAEAADIRLLPTSLQVEGFFACWTRKEAYIKALGTGLSAPLDGFRVTVHPHEPPRLLWVRDDHGEARHWFFETLNEAGVAVALAIRRPSATVRRFSFVPPGV